MSIVAVATIAVLLLGIPLALAVQRLDQSQEVLRLEREANESRRYVSASAIARGGPITINPEGSIRFGVYDLQGRRVGGSGPMLADAPARLALRGDSHNSRRGHSMVAAVPINGDESIVGALRASQPARKVTERVRKAWLLMGLIGAGAVAVAALLGWWQTRRLVQPIDSIVDTAERLGDGDFSARTERSGVPEIDRVGSALNATASRLGDLVSRERAFSADASHQLRTPIAGLRVQAESALLTPSSDARAALERMLPTLDRLEETVDDLLRLARDTHSDRMPLDVGAMLQSLETEWHARFVGSGRRLAVEVGGDLPKPCASAPAIRQVLEVLIDNAQRHGHGAVTMRARRVSRGVSVEVADEGGVVLDPIRVFERRTVGTHGIGLALGRTLAEAEGGRLVLEHQGPGPVFALLLPIEHDGNGSIRE